jgi:rhodanese-related sulfurtransferase
MKNISPKDLKELISNQCEDLQLIDIRDEFEHDICCIGGEKINMYSIAQNIEKISDKKKVVIYCRTGVRSAGIVNLLEKKFSFDNVYNLEGGIMKWREDIDPSLKAY